MLWSRLFILKIHIFKLVWIKKLIIWLTLRYLVIFLYAYFLSPILWSICQKKYLPWQTFNSEKTSKTINFQNSSQSNYFSVNLTSKSDSLGHFGLIPELSFEKIWKLFPNSGPLFQMIIWDKIQRPHKYLGPWRRAFFLKRQVR